MPPGDHVAAARDVYDEAAESYVRFVGTELTSATEGPVDLSTLEDFVGLVKSQATGRVVDVGCGPGRVAAFLADHGLDVVGVDVSRALLAVAAAAHPHIEFREGRLDALPFETSVLAGVASWYSIIYTPPDRLGESFNELARVLRPRCPLILAFQTGGEPVHRVDAFGTRLPLTSYRHGVQVVVDGLTDAGFEIVTNVVRAAELEHETTSQGFVIASRR